jgi:hypothetical protein
MPPGPTLTSSKRPPTIAIYQFRPYRSCEDTYREFGNCDVSSEFVRRETNSLQVVFKEISLRMSRVNAPPIYQYHSTEKERGDVPIVDEYVKHAQEGNEETSTPFSLESNSNHDTGS